MHAKGLSDYTFSPNFLTVGLVVSKYIVFDRQRDKEAYCVPNKIGGFHRGAFKTPKYCERRPGTKLSFR